MSIESWKAEFYPVPAEEVPEEEALAHSLRKWQGLLPENLALHKLIPVCNMLFDAEGVTDEVQIQIQQRPVFAVTSETCALCRHHNPDNCRTCPLFKVRGVPCDETVTDDPHELTPYAAFTKRANARPMLDLLTLAIERRSSPAETRDGELLEENDA